MKGLDYRFPLPHYIRMTIYSQQRAVEHASVHSSSVLEQGFDVALLPNANTNSSYAAAVPVSATVPTES